MNSIILNRSESPIEILHKIFSFYNGARVFTCNTELQAQPRCESQFNFLAWPSHFCHLTVTGASKIFLFSQVMKHIGTNSDDHPEEAVAELKSVISRQLSSVMPPLLLRLRNLGTTHGEKYGAELVMNQLVSLGRTVGLYGPVEDVA